MEPDGRLLALSCYLYFCLLIIAIQVPIGSRVAASGQQQQINSLRVGSAAAAAVFSTAFSNLAASSEQPSPVINQHLLNGKLNPQWQPQAANENYGKLSNNNNQQQQRAKHGCRDPHSLPGDGSSSASSTGYLQQDQLVENPNGFTESQVSHYAKPSYYTLRLKLDPSKRKFTGQLMISLEVLTSNNPSVSGDQLNTPPFSDSSESETNQPISGYRYLSLNVGANIHISRAFYVFGAGGGVQVPASGQARDSLREIITLDFHPNLITPGQGLLLLSYSGQINEKDSVGLFLHHSQRASKQDQQNKAHGSPIMIPVDPTAGLATHMQPSFARRLLPSWDEPSVRSKFKLILVLPFRGYQTISNTPIQRKSISLSCSGEPLQEVEFQQTPLMPIYLLSLVVGHFDYLEAYTANKCRVRVYVYSNSTSPTDTGTGTGSSANTHTGSALHSLGSHNNHDNRINSRRQSAQLALEVAVRSLEQLEQLTGVSYPLSKLDLVALREFNSGGMENWGAAIFHENYLLFDQTSQNSAEIQLNGGRSRPKRKAIPLVVAHELAHQWFGNLVGPISWNYLWLSEGFAQMLMYELAEQLYPSNQYWRIFIEDSRQAALGEDQLMTGSHALEQQRSEQMSALDQLSLFDQITYNKGALVVRMLQQLLSRDTFYSGLQHYLLSNSYKSVQSRQLWRALEQHAKLPDKLLSNLMHGWLTFEGFPLISVHAYEDPTRPDKLMVRLSQERFSLLPLNLTDFPATKASVATQNQSAEQEESPVWWIPVGVASEVAPAPEASELKLELSLEAPSRAFLMRDRAVLLSFIRASTGSWLKLNHNGTGYFRVDYHSNSALEASESSRRSPVESASNKQVDLLAQMAPAVRDRTMSLFDRYNLIDDLFAMVRAARKPTTFYLRYLLEAYPAETEPMVLRSIFDSLRKLRSLLTNAGPRLVEYLDTWTRNYLRLLSESASRPEVTGSLNQEALDLLEAAKLHFNESRASLFARELFTRHFRSPWQAPLPAADISMDRELRAAAYSRALNDAAQDEPDYPASSEFLDEGAPGSRSGSAMRGVAEQQQRRPQDDKFFSLLKFYEVSESSGERYAIAYALGSLETSRLPNKQSKLLNMTLYESFFKPQDTQTLLDSMARTGSGRTLIWESLSANPSALERRQMLSPILKSLSSSHSLIERSYVGDALASVRELTSSTSSGQVEPSLMEGDNNNSNSNQSSIIERELRALYERYQGEHGRTISQAIELLLVNTNWFKRDLLGLGTYLKQFQSQEPLPL